MYNNVQQGSNLTVSARQHAQFNKLTNSITLFQIIKYLLNIQILKMSWFIDDEQFPYQVQRIKNHHVKLAGKQNEKLKYYIEEAFNNFSTKILMKKITNKNIKFQMSVQKYVDNLDAVFLINLNFQLKIIAVYCNIFKNKLPFLIKSRQRSKMIIKETLKQNQFTQNGTISIFLDNGEVSFRVILPNVEGYKYIFKKINLIIFGIPLKQKIIKFNQKIVQKMNYEIQKQKKNHQKLNKLNQIYKYLYRNTIQPTISIKSDSNRQETINKRLLQQVNLLQNLSKNNLQAQVINKEYFKAAKIYCFFQEMQKSILNNEITVYQKQKIQQMLYIPQSKNLNQKQNKYTFNQIIFQQNISNKIKISEGGKSSIYMIKAKIMQINSFEKAQKNELIQNENFKEKYFIKHLVLKQPKKINPSIESLFQNNSYLLIQNKNIQDYKSIEISDFKFKRQLQIISKMKEGSCAFLPKFYHNIQKNSPYKKYLLSQYIPSLNLRQFMKLHSYSMSLTTKLYIVFEIIQSLRFISRYKIVHLDVKQSNFLIYNRLLIKLLDFQEAYHPDVCQTYYKPNFSIPYAPPQVVSFIYGKKFNQKSDVYSLGVLMHNIFYSKLPFYLGENSFYEAHRFNEIQKRIFWNSQQHLTFGRYQQILKIINQIVLKCISSNEIERPYLDWIAVTIKSCLNFFIET